MTTQYRRRIRVLCLHGSTQSAASLRAALMPVCDRMESNWEFHFLDAPFIIADDDDQHNERQSNAWSDAAIQASRLAAIDAELEHAKNRQLDCNTLQEHRTGTWDTLQRTVEGRQTWDTQQQSGVDGVESLISSKVARSMSRGWVSRTSDGQPIGVDVGLAIIGDYMREQGTFHGVIGYGAGATMALLVQALLSYPRSSALAFSTYFAQLPKGMQRMPRMGGWEEQPPAPDDARLGAENLPKDYVPAQKPLEVLIALHPELKALGSRVSQWLEEKHPILRTHSPDAFSHHSLGILHAASHHSTAISVAFERRVEIASDAYVFDKQITAFLGAFLALAIESCQGDQSAGARLTELNTENASALSMSSASSSASKL